MSSGSRISLAIVIAIMTVLVGLFSLLDSVFRMPLPEILTRVVLSDPLSD